MWFIRTITKIADKILGVLTAILAAALLIYSAYVIYDNYHTGQSAFSSWDLQQYKPAPSDDEEKLDFTAIRKINPDAVGWVTIYDTNIDYPIVQGKNDLEYINKDIYGNGSLTGSIYLSSENDGQFLDSYNIIYGHHMDNGAMFGDIDKYEDQQYFMTHRKGELLTPNGMYDLTVFACLKTDAYDTEVYEINNLKNEKLEEIVKYLKVNSEQFYEMDHSKTKKIIALSTCANENTNGRIIIFCDAVPKKAIVHGNQSTKPVNADRVVQGHNTGGSGWALLNLICVFIIMFTLLPLFSIRKKYRQFFYSRKKYKEFDERIDELDEIEKQAGDQAADQTPEQAANQTPEQAADQDNKNDQPAAGIQPNDSDTEEEPKNLRKESEDLKTLSKDLKRFVNKIIIGTVGEIILVIIAIIVFLVTEDMRTPLIISDMWTWLMVSLAVIALLVDYILFRYRGKKLPEENKNDENKNDENENAENDNDNDENSGNTEQTDNTVTA